MQTATSRSPSAHAPMLCLAGFMGSGKTTIGALLARQLAWRFVDLDDLIEAAAGLRIPEFFARHGEPAFRQLEHEQLRAALGRAIELKEATVIALGGGTYAQPANLEMLRAAGAPVIWLDCPIDLLFARCATMTSRPLFRDETGFRELYGQRLPSYQMADFRIEASSEPAAVVAEILRREIVTPGTDSHLLVAKEPKVR